MTAEKKTGAGTILRRAVLLLLVAWCGYLIVSDSSGSCSSRSSSKEGQAARLMITCPNTGTPTATGMSINAGFFETSAFVGMEVVCPHCGETHIWSKKDAYLEGDGSTQ